MNGDTRHVRTVADLVTAAKDPTTETIVVEGELHQVPTLEIAAGVTLAGSESGAALLFAEGVDGLRLSGTNRVSGISLTTDPTQRAISLDPDATDLGAIRLVDLNITGQVALITGEDASSGRFAIDRVHIAEADTRHRKERPELAGVGVLQGAFTVWNRHSEAVLTASIRHVSVGSEQTPIRGSGVFVAGPLEVDLLETGDVFTDGGIPDGTADTISGGVFVIFGAHVEEVRNVGAVTTRGTNDMMLDNWGQVDAWTAEAPLTSYGRSGVGFVNFGTVGELKVLAPIETHGIGARGFNVYHLEGHAGASVGSAEFDSITTHGDAAIGIQIGQPIGRLTIHKGIHTRGGTGESLVKGVLTKLSAHAISVQASGVIEELKVGGELRSDGEGVVPLHVLGAINRVHIAGGLR
ncbi:MAG TPA: hypothetical protein DGT23_19755 [Micromonosporaceae bacterium]|nr:hypothetical protein [Micromonosporaceae bacterium]